MPYGALCGTWLLVMQLYDARQPSRLGDPVDQQWLLRLLAVESESEPRASITVKIYDVLVPPGSRLSA